MNDKTIKERQRKSLDPSRFVHQLRSDLMQWRPVVEGHKRNLTITENVIKQRLGKSSSRNQIAPPTTAPQPESQNTRKSNQKGDISEAKPQGLKSYLSEKCLKNSTQELGESRIVAQGNDRLNQQFISGHFINANYKSDPAKVEHLRQNSRSHWAKSNLSIQKKDSSAHLNRNSNNNSLIVSVLAKNKQSSKLKNLLLDDASPNLIETKNKALQKNLRGTADNFQLPLGLNIPNSPVKHRQLFINQNTLNNIMNKKGKARVCEERETQERNMRGEALAWEAQSPASVIKVVQNSVKHGDAKESAKLDQNYFFNLRPLQKLRLHERPSGLSQKSGLRSALSNNQSGSDGGNIVEAEPAKAPAPFAKKLKIETSIKKPVNRRNQSSKLHPDVASQFPDLLTDRVAECPDQREPLLPKFQQIFQNMCSEKETDDLRSLKDLIATQRRAGTIPETDMSFYDIVKRIGEGSFGKVYLGLQRLTNRLVAIKRLDKANCKDEITRKKVLSEVNIQKMMFGHPNIIKLLEVFENKQYVYFVMEYAANGDLLRHVKRTRKIEEEEAKSVFFQVASGLRYIHHNGIIHRDIKLDNVLIDEHNHYKICDFGVGRAMRPHELINEQCGTPAYLAPEIVLEKGYSGFGADVWSLGVLLFCLLTGSMPFKAATLERLNELISKGEYEYPTEVVISSEVKELIAGMLCVEPAKRLTIESVLEHPWVRSVNMARATFQNINRFEQEHFKILSDNQYRVNEAALTFVEELGYDRAAVRECVLQKQMNHATACYFTIERDFV